MAMTKADYEATLGRKLSDAEYAQLANVPPLHAKFDAAPPPWVPSHAAPVPLPPPAPGPMLMIAPKPEAMAPPIAPQPMPSFEAAKKGGLAAFVKNPQAFDTPAAPPIGPPGPPIAQPPAPAPMPQPGAVYKGGSGAFGGGGPAASAPTGPTLEEKALYGKNPYDVAYDKQVVNHLGKQGDLQQQMAATEAEQADEFANISQGVAAKYELEAQKAEKAAARRKVFLNEYNAETNAKVEEYVNAKVDPARYWHDKGTGGTILATIGMALGGWAQAMAAGAGQKIENGAMEMIERGIARDIELQKGEIARKGAGLDARKGLYTQYLQQFGDEQVAENMAMETYLRKAKAEIDAQAAKTSSQQVKIQAAAMGEALQDKIVQFRNGTAARGVHLWDEAKAREDAARAAGQAAAANELKKRNQAFVDANLKAMTERITKNGGIVLPAQQNIPIPGGGFIPAGMPVAYTGDGKIDMGGTEALGKIATVNMPVLQPGGSVAFSPVAVQKEGYGKAAEQINGATNAIKAIEQMEAADKMPGPWVGEKKKLFNQAQKNYATAYGVASGMGALSEADLEIVYSTIPGVPTWGVGYMSDAERASLASQKKALAEKAKTASQVYGTPESAGPAPLTSIGEAK